MEYRQIVSEDASKFLELLIGLDNETKFMLYEPEERKMTLEETAMMLNGITASGSIVYGAFSDDCIAGFATLRRGGANRNKHSGYVVIGVRSKYSGKGIGKNLLNHIERWSLDNEITRLELTVMKHNIRAYNLYKKVGYEVEGTKKKSLVVDGDMLMNII